MTPTERLKDEAKRLGFELSGVAEAKPAATFERFRDWIDAGCHAGMDYLAKNVEARFHPKSVLEGVRTLLVLGVSYEKVHGETALNLYGVARYARGVDYHDWIRERLRRLSVVHRELFPGGRCRGVVDTAPILERQFAVDAGLGWIGRNTMLIHPEFGSRFFLAALLSSETLTVDPAAARTNSCENCRRCRDACPTGAIVEPYVLDARRCLNYWTIEHRGEMPLEIVEKLGDRFFGCDTCQDVCPWNRPEPKPMPSESIDPRSLDPETFDRMIEGTPLKRRFGRLC